MENLENTFSRIGQGIRNSVMAKFISVAIIALLLLIPAANIESLIYERQQRRDTVVQEVSSKWGGKQLLAGPVLNVPYKSFYETKEQEVKYSIEYAHFLPEKLNVTGKVQPDKRKRGIYEVVLYNTDLHFSGSFKKPDFTVWNIEPENILWDEAFVSVGIPDMAGIQKELMLKWNGTETLFEAGLPEQEVFKSGLISRIGIGDDKDYSFSFQLDLNGSGQIMFVPAGKTTSVSLTSSWPDPSFNGRFLPDHHTVDATGFTAEWDILAVNRNFPQQWRGGGQQLEEAGFGVSLILPVDEYQKNMRSVKYALLVIALTFMIFFLIEILNKRRFHIFQYVMVGFAIVLFYSLLISFTEHLGFNTAYLLAALLVTGLITIYVRAVFGQRTLTILVMLLLATIYGFIFIILQLQDFALLVGSLGLFIALASLMYLSRNVNWYAINYKSPDELQQAE